METPESQEIQIAQQPETVTATITSTKRVHTSSTLHPEVVARMDQECDAKRGGVKYSISRSDVIEDALRVRYGMQRMTMGPFKKPVDPASVVKKS